MRSIEILAALLFTLSTGVLFSERVRQKKVWVSVAAALAIASTLFTVDQLIQVAFSKSIFAILHEWAGRPSATAASEDKPLRSDDEATKRRYEAELAKLQAQIRAQTARAEAEKLERDRIQAEQEATHQRQAAEKGSNRSGKPETSD